MQKCPQTKIVMSGYSQGGQVVHNSANALGPNIMAKINSVVIFGDPSVLSIPLPRNATDKDCWLGNRKLPSPAPNRRR